MVIREFSVCYHLITTNAHDTGYKRLVSTLKRVRDRILNFVPGDWLQHLDYSTPERMPGGWPTLVGGGQHI